MGGVLRPQGMAVVGAGLDYAKMKDKVECKEDKGASVLCVVCCMIDKACKMNTL